MITKIMKLDTRDNTRMSLYWVVEEKLSNSIEGDSASSIADSAHNVEGEEESSNHTFEEESHGDEYVSEEHFQPSE